MSGLPLAAQVVLERVLNSIPEGLLIAAFAWSALAILRKQNSGTRFAVWFAALLAVVVTPFVPHMTSRGSATVVSRTPEITLSPSWATAILGAWALIAFLASARLLTGLWRLRELRRNSREIPLSELDPALWETVEQFQSERKVTICSSTDVNVPTAIGFFRPVILIPEWTLRELPAEELRAVLFHEFAHLGRWDDWTNLVQKTVRTIFFFHPAVWWIESRLSIEREMACDDLVLAKTRSPKTYAKCLVSLAEKSLIRRGLAMTQAAISRAHETTLRLARILSMDPPAATGVVKPVLASVAALAVISFAALPDLPKLVAFREPATPSYAMTAEDVLPALPPSAVVPAVARVSSSTRVAARPSTPKSKPTRIAPTTAESVVAKQQQRSLRPDELYHPATLKQAEPVQDFLVVMQTTDFDDYGSAYVSFTVWRVAVKKGQPREMRSDVVAKQT